VFDELMTDTLTLRKPDGRVFEKISACVTAKGILIQDVRLPIEIGDKLTRLLPNGVTDEFTVDDPGFHQAFSEIAAHFQVKVRRASAEKKASPVYNVFHGPVGNVAQNSHSLAKQRV
jgi:hypothetical protein